MNRMEDSSKNNFDKRGGELMPRNDGTALIVR